MPDDQQRREGTTAPDPDSGRSDTPPRKAEAKAGAEAEKKPGIIRRHPLARIIHDGFGRGNRR
jgi:hypothetical protein